MEKSRMKRRYWFIGVPVALVVAYWAFADMVIKSVMETQLTQAHGAEVNIGDFDHSLFPLTVTLKDVQMTDAQRPLRNQVVAGEISGDVEFMPLLSSQLIMNKVSLLEVAFDKPRSSAGEVLRVPESSFSFDSLLTEAKEAVPSVDELLARSPLKTTAAVQEAQAAYAKHADSLQDDYDALPDKARLDYYKTQIKQLQDTDYKDPAALLKAKETLTKLKDDIKADRAVIGQFTDNASQARKALSDSLEALKSAPQQDYALLQGVIAGDEAALSQLTQAIFGEKAAQYNQYLMAAFQIVMPMLTGDSSSDEAAEAASNFMVLIREANISVNWADERFTSDWTNITNAHDISGKPTTFALNAASQAMNQFVTEGQFYIGAQGVNANQTWQLAGVALNQVSLFDDERLDAAIKHAILAATGSLSIVDGKLDGSSNVDLTELAMAAAGNDKITSAIAGLLSDLDALSMTLSFDGKLTSPEFRLNSDLDNRLAQAALTELSRSQQGKLDELNTKLQAMVGTQETQIANKLGNVNQLLAAAQSDDKALQEMLSAQLSSVVEKQKSKLLDKLTDKLNGR